MILFADISVQCTKCVSNWPAIKIPADSAESVQTFCTAGIENIAERSNKARLTNLCFGIFKIIRCCTNTLVIPVTLFWYGVFWWLTDDCCWYSKVKLTSETWAAIALERKAFEPLVWQSVWICAVQHDLAIPHSIRWSRLHSGYWRQLFQQGWGKKQMD